MSVFQTLLPTIGPGALKSREDPNERAGKVRLLLLFVRHAGFTCSSPRILIHNRRVCRVQYTFA